MNPSNEDFRKEWNELADNGTCDAIDGAEFKRIFREWEALGCPSDLVHFISVRANTGSNGEAYRASMN